MASPEQVYEQTCPSIPQQLLDGYNCTVVAYGASGTGKSHTLTGALPTGEEQGIVQRLVTQIFETLSQKDSSIEFTVRCSVVEIYLERLRDLLQESSKVRLKQVGRGGVVLAGCSALSCVSSADVVYVVQRAAAARTCSAADPNRDSTRSSCIVQLQIEQLDLRSGIRTTSRLHVFDLLASELIHADGRATLEASQVSLSLKTLHKQVRELKDGRPIEHDLPAVTKLLVNSLIGDGSACTTFLLTVSPSNSSVQETVNTVRFGIDCRALCTRPVVHAIETIDNEDAVKLAAALEKQERLERLAKALANECQRLRDKKSWDRVLWPRIEQIRVADDEQRKVDFIIETKELHETKLERMQQYARLKKAVDERDLAVSERDQLCADLAILQAQNIVLREQQAKLREEASSLKQNYSLLQNRKQKVEHNLRISQFRESEAVVFMRQLRRFYYRLLKKTAVEGTGEISDVTKRVPGAPDLVQLVDIDHLMMESGLLEKRDVGGDVPIDCRPSRESLERSTTEADRAAANALETEEALEVVAESAATDDVDVVPIACSPACQTSIVSNRESVDKVEARQKLYRTPAGRCVALREKLLEEELLQMSELNSQLQTQLAEEKTNVKSLTDRNGVDTAFDKMRVAQETRLLKEQLARKNNDLKAVIWKMNELHLVGKTLQTKSHTLEQHVSHMEENLAAARNQSGINLEERQTEERRLRDEIRGLQRLVENATVPVWQLAGSAMANLPLPCRLVIPFTTNENDLQMDFESNLSTGEPGEWMDYDFYPSNNNLSEVATQTDLSPMASASTQTPVNVVDRSKTASIAIQTDDAHFLYMSQEITEDNVNNFMFMDSPTGQDKPLGVPFDNLLMELSPLSSRPTRNTFAIPDSHLIASIIDCPPKSTHPNNDLSIKNTEILVATYAHELTTRENSEANTLNTGNNNHDLSTPDSDDTMLFDSQSSPTKPLGRAVSQRRDSGRSPQQFRTYDDADGRIISGSDLNPVHLMIDNSSKNDRASSTPCKNAYDQLGSIERTISADAMLFMDDSANKVDAEVVGEVLSSTTERHNAIAPSTCTIMDVHQEQNPINVRSNDDQQSADQCKNHREPTLFPSSIDKIENRKIPTKASSQKTGPRLSSFLDKLQKQTQRKLDSDEKSSTPEFMKMFNKIGVKNKNESVLETSGSAPARDGTRTSFELMRHTSQSIKPSGDCQSAPLKKWTPRQKKTGEDSDSDDDSFARQFIRGAQMANSGGVKPLVIEEDSSDSLNSNDRSDNNSSHDEPAPNTKTRQADPDSDDSSDKEPKPPVQPSLAVTLPNCHVNNDSESDDSSDDDSTVQHKPTPTKPTPVSPTPAKPIIHVDGRKKYSDTENSNCDKPKEALKANQVIGQATAAPFSRSGKNKGSDSDSDSSSHSKNHLSNRKPAAAFPAAIVVRDKDSDSDSDQSSKQEKKSHIKPSPTASALRAEPDAEYSGPSRFGRRNDSDYDSSDDESKVAVKPVVIGPTITLSMASRVERKDDSCSDSSDDESKAPLKPFERPETVMTASRFGRKDELDSDASSDDESKAPMKPIEQKPATITSAFSLKRKDDSNSDDSSESVSETTPKPVERKPVVATLAPHVGRKDESDSDSSSDGESKPPLKPIEQKLNTTTPASLSGRKKPADSDSSSDEESKAPPKPVSQKAAVKTSASLAGPKDESDTDSADDELTIPAKATDYKPAYGTTTSRLRRKDDSDSDSSDADSSDDESKLPAMPVATQQKPPAATISRLVSKGESSGSSEGEESATPHRADPSSSKPQSKDSESSDDESHSSAELASKNTKEHAKSPDDGESSEGESLDANTSKKISTKSSAEDESSNEDDTSSEESASERTEIIDLTNHKEPGPKADDKNRFVGGKLSDAQPKTKVPDFASSITSGVSQDSKLRNGTKIPAMKNGKSSTSDSNSKGSKSPSSRQANTAKFVIKGGKLVKNDNSTADNATSSDKTKKKFVIKDGKLIKAADSNSASVDAKAADHDDSAKARGKSTKTTFVIKDGKLVKKDAASSSASPKKIKPGFSIVDGKLVKTKEGSTSSNKVPRQSNKDGNASKQNVTTKKKT